MKKTLSRKDYVKKLDEIFSLYIRLRDSDENGFVTCPLCGARVHRKKSQNMHFVPRGCYALRRSGENCYAGCMRCNVILHGNYIVYTRRMQKKFGIEKVDEMIGMKHKVIKISTEEIKNLINIYQEKINALISRKYQSDFYSFLKK